MSNPTSPVAGGGEATGFAPIAIEKASPARRVALLRAICDEGQITMRDGEPVCGRCPAYTSGGDGTLRIRNVIEGNFTRAGASEVLVDLRGCEPPSRRDGASVLLEENNRRWSRTLYLAGLRSNECVRFRNVRQTLLLACNMFAMERGVQRGELVLLELRDAKPVQHFLLRWLDNSESNPRRLFSAFPHRFLKSDFNQDGRVDLQVHVRIRDEPVPEKYPGFIDAIIAGHQFAEPRAVRLLYLFDGTTLSLSPASEAAIHDIDALLERAGELPAH
jgi:hypothetical protein